MRLLFASAAALALAACQPAAVTPDAIVFGGTVYTGVDGQPTAEAVAVKGGRVLSLGKSDALLKTAKPSTVLVDLKGAFLYPGFTDAHAHLYGIGEREQTLDLDEITSIAQLVQVVGDAAKAAPAGQPLEGRGWIETHWPEKRFPTRQDIDAVTGDRPVVLTRADGHALLANTAALKAAGIDGKPASQPDGGRIEVDAAGLPTGMLIDNAMGALAALAVEPTPEAIDKTYETGSAKYASLGWTGVHNMSVAATHVLRINALSDGGKLPLRIYNAVDAGGMRDDGPGKFGEGVISIAKGGLVTTRAIKLYMDGALGSRGALLEAPYSDRPDITGLQRAKEAETLALLKRAYEEGVQVSFHAIGDRGNELVLNWMEQTFATATPEEKAKRDPRWRIEHAQILRPQDIPRFKADGIIPSMQPSHAIGDLYFAPDRLGPDRLAGAYAWRALIDAGSIIAGGSDAPVEQGDPRIEFYAAVARKDLKGNALENWHPEQAVTRAEALKMFTAWPAYASFREKDLGTIEPGKIADFTAFSGDIMTIPEAEILKVEPVLAMVAGAVTWSRK
jgi:predicted amidohydrolase YtcJ